MYSSLPGSWKTGAAGALAIPALAQTGPGLDLQLAVWVAVACLALGAVLLLLASRRRISAVAATLALVGVVVVLAVVAMMTFDLWGLATVLFGLMAAWFVFGVLQSLSNLGPKFSVGFVMDDEGKQALRFLRNGRPVLAD